MTQADFVEFIVFDVVATSCPILGSVAAMTVGRRRRLIIIIPSRGESTLLLLLLLFALHCWLLTVVEQVLVIVEQWDGTDATNTSPDAAAAAAALVVGFVTLDAAIQRRFGGIDRLCQDGHHFLTGGSGRRHGGSGTSWHFVDGSKRQVHHALNRLVGVDVHLDGHGRLRHFGTNRR